MEIAFLILRILLAAALYIFLGLAIWVLWRQLRYEAQKSHEILAPPIVLEWIEDRMETRGYRQTEVIIGRQPGCDLRLKDKTISAKHARMSFHHGQWWAEDLHSKNGTFLNDERLTTAMVLTNGDAVRCGSVHLNVKIGNNLTDMSLNRTSESQEQTEL